MGRALATLLLALLGCSSIRSSPRIVTDPPPANSPYILVLGIAQDAGLPQMGATHPNDVRARRDPAFARLATSLLLADPVSGERWLFDVTPDIRMQVDLAAGHPRSRPIEGPRPALFDGAFLTHGHMGHYAGLVHFGREAYAAKNMPVYGTPAMVDYLASNGPWELMVRLENIELRGMEPGSRVRLNERLAVRSLPVPHRQEYTDTVAYVIEGPSRSVLFVPDIDRWHELPSLDAFLEGVDAALIDGSFYAEGEIPGRSMADIPHPLIRTSIETFSGRPQQFIFIHLNHTNPALDRESDAAREIEAAGFSVARQGQVFPL